jgi:hypothetical protein
MVHDGEMRRSEDELGELMMRGTSAALWRDMLTVGASAAWQDAVQSSR